MREHGVKNDSRHTWLSGRVGGGGEEETEKHKSTSPYIDPLSAVSGVKHALWFVM